jgi:uncharacterized protein (DUF952 family)
MYILHITDQATWQKAQKKGIYENDALFTGGFIHCCLRDHVQEVLAQWFKGASNLIILEIDPAKLTSKVIYENLEGGETLFPHIYGPINLNAVVGIENVEQ